MRGERENDGKIGRREGAARITKRGLGWSFRELPDVSWRLRRHGASHGGDERELCVRDEPLSSFCPPRDVPPPSYDFQLFVST
jgi:hypothetical protein